MEREGGQPKDTFYMNEGNGPTILHRKDFTQLLEYTLAQGSLKRAESVLFKRVSLFTTGI